MGRNWSASEDAELIKLTRKYGKQWGVIASHMKNRSPAQVLARWEKCLDPVIVKGPFTEQEDELIRQFVKENGPQNWPKITSFLPNRSPKQCRERWFNHLDPSVIKHAWTPEEDETIFRNYQKLGPKWSVIAKLIPGRTDNAIKNRWNSSLSKRISVLPGKKEVLLPDKSKKRKNVEEPKKEEEKSPAKAEIPFDPFSIPSPHLTRSDSSRLNSPDTPMMGFNTTPGAFGGLIISPVLAVHPVGCYLF
ncbi:Myb-like DNA-binding domain containing protein [Trichomonas vaginalis G3]|uniref:Myb-like DNA-binding domain containing protein n=1 Tax=Trichomonas vaginalis (strain ATCC PRA-98 / G3) TaxID=412133 RepID=A2EIM0_TRIV3|nr:RNA polymerase II transcription regulator recruiting protein [Trichomonas vaginalis G3]EAY07541.1 Myb-like DNA-binding domain containing protein [Trichomonas vaginalis G3]KAI5550506.1 RNA polymerase II transcription regulator recruiting protein [Trichomonas vaginalis G3]|eukprot:XP_001319764.1 Myb-like DNA-binding domain containing protein [Trichomonas vaginalis G3]